MEQIEYELRDAMILADSYALDDAIMLDALEYLIETHVIDADIEYCGRILMVDKVYVEPKYRGHRKGLSFLEQALNMCENLFSVDYALLQASPLGEYTNKQVHELKKSLTTYYGEVGFQRVAYRDDHTVMMLKPLSWRVSVRN